MRLSALVCFHVFPSLVGGVRVFLAFGCLSSCVWWYPAVSGLLCLPVWLVVPSSPDVCLRLLPWMCRPVWLVVSGSLGVFFIYFPILPESCRRPSGGARLFGCLCLPVSGSADVLQLVGLQASMAVTGSGCLPSLASGHMSLIVLLVVSTSLDVYFHLPGGVRIYGRLFHLSRWALWMSVFTCLSSCVPGSLDVCLHLSPFIRLVASGSFDVCLPLFVSQWAVWVLS